MVLYYGNKITRSEGGKFWGISMKKSKIFGALDLFVNRQRMLSCDDAAKTIWAKSFRATGRATDLEIVSDVPASSVFQQFS